MAVKTLLDIAGADNRLYTTPEDVQEAIDSGIKRIDLYAQLLAFIERKAVEDASCAAFVALKFLKKN